MSIIGTQIAAARMKAEWAALVAERDKLKTEYVALIQAMWAYVEAHNENEWANSYPKKMTLAEIVADMANTLLDASQVSDVDVK